MAVLIDADRAEVTGECMRRMSTGFGGITKAQLRAVIDATDSWIDSNAASFNTAIPATQRAALSQTEKTLIFCYVSLKRAGVL